VCADRSITGDGLGWPALPKLLEDVAPGCREPMLTDEELDRLPLRGSIARQHDRHEIVFRIDLLSFP